MNSRERPVLLLQMVQAGLAPSPAESQGSRAALSYTSRATDAFGARSETSTRTASAGSNRHWPDRQSSSTRMRPARAAANHRPARASPGSQRSRALAQDQTRSHRHSHSHQRPKRQRLGGLELRLADVAHSCRRTLGPARRDGELPGLPWQPFQECRLGTRFRRRACRARYCWHRRQRPTQAGWPRSARRQA